MKNTVIICCCGASHECANRVLIAMGIISHAVLNRKKERGQHFIYTNDELDPNELSILQRFGVLAVQADEIYQKRPPRQFAVFGESGDEIDNVHIEEDNEYDALVYALGEISECRVSERNK